ncbi:MAG TPA: hypothetical protein VI197_04555 [Polyangiaceae bacterium]
MPEAAEQQSKKMRREDPPPRPVEQTANRGQLVGQDGTKHYVWVNEANSDPTFNVATYRALGYKVSQYDENDDAKPSIGWNDYKQGDPIRSMGMLLMECPMELKEARDRDGWEKADRIQEAIRHREIDPLTPEERRDFRGITSTRARDDDRKRWEF